MAIKCPRCKALNPPDFQRCRKCGTLLENPPESKTKTLRSPIKDVQAGEMIDEKYKIINRLGSGGMGVVYKAEQIKPVKRIVAIKIVKLGMDTKQVVARFESERQALAVMDHPHIAKVFDAGATETGRPYFVMEYVKGEAIKKYCDKHNLSTEERLELFIGICQAVQHAHQKGVIHRDLKSSNVIITIEGDRAVPKIIDFGIAKATGQRLTEKTLFTEKGQLIGTPEYMSPEQAEMSGLDVDTRTDIYSLGVMLYELLVGVLPFDSKELRAAGFNEIQRMIRETDPPKASTRFSKLGETRTSIAEHRKTDPESLERRLRGDLDWISMKAMAKDRTRRYESASEMASDIIKHLKNEPVLASPPSRLYRAKKYMMRHRTGVVAAALVVLAMIIGITGTSIGLIRARKAEQKAQKEAETATQVSNFLVDLFEVSDPSEAKGNTITAREILDKGAEKIESGLESQPETRARLMKTMGRVYRNLALYKQSEELLNEALKITAQEYGERSAETAEVLYRLTILKSDKGEHQEAEKIGKECLEICENKLGEERELTARILTALGHVYHNQGKYKEAESTHFRSLEIKEKIYPEGHINLSPSLDGIANALSEQEKYKEAESYYKRALNITEKHLGKNHPDYSSQLFNLGILSRSLGKIEEAENFFKRSLAINEASMKKSMIHPIPVLPEYWMKLVFVWACRANMNKEFHIFKGL